MNAAIADILWLDRGTIVSAVNRGSIDRLFDKIQRCKFKTVYFECNNAGYALFDTAKAARSLLTGQADPLKLALEAAHARGLQLHAWFWIFAVGNTKYNDLVGADHNFPGPVLQRLGLDVALRTNDGSLLLPGQTEFWLSPANAVARRYVLDLILECIENYAVDGLHLDYIRFPFQKSGSQAGFDHSSRESYKEATGRDLFDTCESGASQPFLLNWLKQFQQSFAHFDHCASEAVVSWKTELVNSFVQDLSEEVRSASPSLPISAAVFAIPLQKRLNAIQQHWELWLEKKWIDTVNPMTYDPATIQFERTLRELAALCSSETAGAINASCIVPALAVERLTRQQFYDHLEIMYKCNFRQAAIFAAAHLNSSIESWFI